MDDSKVQSALLGWIISLAITVSVLLRRDKDIRQRLFVLLSGNVVLYYFFTFLYAWQGEPWFERISLAFAVLLPQSGMYFFRAFSSVPKKRLHLQRVAMLLGVVLIGVILYPSLMRPAIGPAVLAYVVGFMLVAILDLNVQARTASTRIDAARSRYLFGGGLTVLSLQIIEMTGHVIRVEVPPVGLAMTLLYLYMISQAIVRYRILDLYEMLGRLAVMTLMGVALAGIYTALVFWPGKGFAINAFLASLVILLLFDPLRDLAEQKIADVFFGERHILEQKIADLRLRLAHIINIDIMVESLLFGLEDSRRVTHASLYLIDAHGRGFDRKNGIGPPPDLTRVEVAQARRYFRPFITRGAVVSAVLASRKERLLQAEKGETTEQLSEAIDLMERLAADVLLPIEGEEDLLGFLTVKDERIKDAFSPEEVSLLCGLTGQVAITVENSQLYQQMKERDRLAALGQMSAGLAHEIRNPLGAIKAAAQYIEEISDDSNDSEASQDDREFLTVIVEESDRLNRVVSDFLDYARPSRGVQTKVKINEILKKTLQVFETGRSDKITLTVETADDLPGVIIDGEKLHQVFLNLIINAVQSMEKILDPQLKITTRVRMVRKIKPHQRDVVPAKYVEIRFSDNGPGIKTDIVQNIFIPFFTTKSKGSGLGLSICQRIVRGVGGEIEVRSQEGQGTIFTVVLPTSERPSTGGFSIIDPQTS